MNCLFYPLVYVVNLRLNQVNSPTDFTTQPHRAQEIILQHPSTHQSPSNPALSLTHPSINVVDELNKPPMIRHLIQTLLAWEHALLIDTILSEPSCFTQVNKDP